MSSVISAVFEPQRSESIIGATMKLKKHFEFRKVKLLIGNEEKIRLQTKERLLRSIEFSNGIATFDESWIHYFTSKIKISSRRRNGV